MDAVVAFIANGEATKPVVRRFSLASGLTGESSILSSTITKLELSAFAETEWLRQGCETLVLLTVVVAG